ncbi:hypothetical protein [Silvibacterium sp.]|uniref:hypothetical protein n=1 Tax=Silvibacterium sp. TaxID=1964179 RepID=UPI0039E338C9
MSSIHSARMICAGILMFGLLTAHAQQTVTTPGGSSGYIPAFTGTTTIGSSIIQTNSTGVGIGRAPNGTLDVNGQIVARGWLTMARLGNATTSAGSNSAPILFQTSGYNSSSKADQTPYFQFQANAVNNNTSTPGATLNFLYGNGTSALADTGLYINSNGTIHFASAQTFPSTANGITSVAHDNSLTGAGTSASPLGINGVTTNASFTGSGTAASPLAFSANVAMPGTLTTSGAITGSTSSSDAIYGNSTNAYGTGVTGVSYGTYGYGMVAEGTVDGIYAYGGTYAGQFYGNVAINGNLSKSGGSFKIDDPLDPENKYLSHSFVESPDMMNIYNGNVTTDSSGYAKVDMPAWFEALNQDFRYQLTPIGQFSQAIVASEISTNSFTIRTDKPNVKVSWQVTGVRHDAWANAHRIPVEEDKAEQDRGRFLHPELFGHKEQPSISLYRPPLSSPASR